MWLPDSAVLSGLLVYAVLNLDQPTCTLLDWAGVATALITRHFLQLCSNAVAQQGWSTLQTE